MRDALLDAAERRDVEALVPHLAGRVRYFEEEMTRAELADTLRRDRDQTLKLLEELRVALRMGVAMDDGVIRAPYVAAAARIVSNLAPGNYAVVTGANVVLRAAPATTARAVGAATFDVVRVVSDADVKTPEGSEKCAWWSRVELRAGMEGWICADYLASPLDTRFAFGVEDGRWRLASVYIGD